MRLHGKVAVVTGTSSGIGKVIAETFASEGAAVVTASRREATGAPVAEGIRGRGGRAIFVRCDISVESDVSALFRACEAEFGRVDVLVNNAGVDFAKPFDRTSIDEWDRVINTDLRGTFLCTREAIRAMLAQGGGSIVNVTSVHTIAAVRGAAPYDAAKWGTVGLTKALAVEYADRNIRVNSLAPGLIRTAIWDDLVAAASDLQQCVAYWNANIPARRIGLPEEIARAAVFLASDESSYVTGSNLVVDGGMTSQLISAAPYESKPVEGRTS